MCLEGSWPRAAAYAIDTGAFQWASCTDERSWLTVVHADDDAVHLWLPLIDPDATVALDLRTGEELPSAPPIPREAFGDRTGAPIITELDGAQVTGGQDDPVTVRLADGTSWSQPGRWAYDNVFAIGDGAVFAIERAGPTSRLVGYELQTGDVRWAHEGDAASEGLWPWAIADGRLYTLWSNLQVRSTADGSLVWATAYPAPEDSFLPPSPDAPRMSGVAIGEDRVYVSFATGAFGGD
jgi:hypothetical protein